MRVSSAVLINILVPGAGLIALRREWLGLAVALLFWVLAEIGIIGLWLTPATIPARVSVGMLIAAFTVWAGCQWLLIKRIRVATGDAVERELTLLSRRVEEAIAKNSLAEAHDLLRAALMLNDEHLEINRRWADLMTKMARNREAARAWHRVIHLEPDPEKRRAARRELEQLSAESNPEQRSDQSTSSNGS